MTGGTEALLCLRGLAKSFGTTQVLQSLDLEVRRGEVVALVGENGSGKSTTARIVAGVLQPDAGEVIVDGTARRLRPAEARQLGICYVGQEPALVSTLSVRVNLQLAGLGWWSPGRRGPAADATLADVGLDVDPRRLVGTLSAAQKAQLEIAKALLLRPRLLVLDEVTTRMPDPSVLLDLVAGLAEQGVGSILITHRFAEIHALADRAVVLRDGCIVGELARGEITDSHLGEMMVGREVSLLERQPSQRRSEVALHAEGLRLAEGTAPIDLMVHAGEVVGVGGLMGSGRSRLLETLAGVRGRAEGRVAVDGTGLRSGSVVDARAAGVCFVPEDRDRQGLVRRHSIRANVCLGTWSAFQRPEPTQEHRTAERMISALRIKAPDCEVRVDTLSGGNAQKVVFARELARAPRVLVLDEPTRGVDIGARADIYEILRSRAGHGAAVLIASSDLQELAALCDRVLVLFEGSVVGELIGEEIREEAIVLLASGVSTSSAVAEDVINQ